MLDDSLRPVLVRSAVQPIDLRTHDTAPQGTESISFNLSLLAGGQPRVLLTELHKQLIDADDVSQLLRIARPELIVPFQFLETGRPHPPIGP